MTKHFISKNYKQFIKFAVVGASGVVVDWVVYFILTRYLELFYLISKTISFLFAAINNYIWNRSWTFRSKENKIAGEFAKFFLVSLIGLGLNLIIMYISVEIFKINDLYSLVIATGIVTIWNYLANKLWTFKEKNENSN